MVGVAVRPAGCHHGATPPTSLPVSYRCCQSGHDSAIPQSSLAMHLSSGRPVSTGDSILAPIIISTQSCRHSLMISSPDPPHAIPLRI